MIICFSELCAVYLGYSFMEFCDLKNKQTKKKPPQQNKQNEKGFISMP